MLMGSRESSTDDFHDAIPDVNECDNPGVCEHECKNTIGSYECKCRAGFEPDKRNTAKCVGE